jgi:hypothetical protein
VPDEPHRRAGSPVARAVVVAVTLGYALWLAATVPFSSAANLLTGVAIVAVIVMAIIRWPWHPSRSGVLADEQPRHPYLGWVVLFGIIVAWELVMYLVRGSRSAHPTLSSMADAFDRYNYFAKAVACFAWLWLGGAIVRAGGPPPAARPADQGVLPS